MPLQITCPGCKITLAIPDSSAGKQVRCPKCQTITMSPAAAPPPVAAAVQAPAPAPTPPPIPKMALDSPRPADAVAPEPMKPAVPMCSAAEEPEWAEPIPPRVRKKSSAVLVVVLIAAGALAASCLVCGGTGVGGLFYLRARAEQADRAREEEAHARAQADEARWQAEDARRQAERARDDWAKLDQELRKKLEAIDIDPNPDRIRPPGQVPAAPPLVLPLLPAAVPIRPAPVKEKTEYKLPDTVDALAVGGGGRFLVLHFPKQRKLSVFDANEAKIAYAIDVAEGRLHIAAGMTKLLVYHPDSQAILRYDLLTQKLEASGKLATAEKVESFCVGSASAGPLLVAAGGSARLYDPLTFDEMPVPKEQGRPHGLEGGRYWASPDGRTFGRLDPGGNSTLILEGGQARKARSEKAGGWYTMPGPDGRHVYVGGHGVFTVEGQPSPEGVPANEQFSGTVDYMVVPAHHGPYYAHLHMKLRLRGPLHKQDPEEGLTFYLLGEKRPVAFLPNLGTVTWAEMGALQGLGIERTVHLIPRAKLLVVMPASRDKLMLHPFDPEEALEKSGINYLVVTSQPPEARAGHEFAYKIEAKSKPGGPKYKLESGPLGMTATPDGILNWRVPGDLAGKEVTVNVSVQDSSGQTRLYTFTVAVRDGN